ncbi:UPF0755 protein [Amphibacillus marinus]|uniref:Endolytic murein transglycosylase n=1 Tax=Amphibacillus marinus TaxID=872970 RepID=A0A1H8NWI9_9BACI|nr:endolytic transglycosylase MltG [Amphibacillus marinus]SEO33961.1 UPF0755 protein [Amphibacillus marinus]
MSNSEHDSKPEVKETNEKETDLKNEAVETDSTRSDFKKAYNKSFIQRCREASVVRKVVFILITIFIAVLFFGGRSAYRYVMDGLAPADPNNTEMVNIEIPLGSSSSTITSMLEDEGIISNGRLYRLYMRVNNVSGFQAGEYQLSPSMTLDEISEILQSGSIMQDALFTVTIPEGRNIEEIAGLYETHANIDAEEFIEAMLDETYIQELIDLYPNLLGDEILQDDVRYPLEGYLFAATYPFYEQNPSIDTVVRSMLDKTEDVLLDYYSVINERKDFSVHEVLTFASLVEREARNEDERKLIAGVFYNRLEEGMRLETDPTVLYALGEHRGRVLFADLEIESPYNTYHVFGLPIGPISNFGESSLNAVLEPTETNYLFFVAAPDGEIYFSENFDEHRRLANEHLDRDL